MADKPEVAQVTNEKKKVPKRVEAGKRLAAIRKLAKEKKKNSWKMNQREEMTLETKTEPDTVSIEKSRDSNIDSLE
ncbi:Hypothetical predicted protein [Paramuricea clavata]|uniref:Uncharacterized protein n=1 Tax=Paramuricea clavata TaxID=317549 RepID=A0A7D9DTZ0_PARCT|nr:Hypothetical predicted protein [Paramuricea clavata]